MSRKGAPARASGDRITLDVQRGERRLAVRVPVVERESGSTRLMDLKSPQNSIRTLGIFALDLTRAAERLTVGSPAVLQIERDGALMYVVFRLDAL